MPVRKAEATWRGDLQSGSGSMRLASGLLEAPFSVGTRIEEEPGTNPEELIAAAHAGCFSMALASRLGKNGHKAEAIHTTADVRLEKVGERFAITKIRLTTRATVPGLDEAAFGEHAAFAKENCPVSKALSGTEIELDARLAPG